MHNTYNLIVGKKNDQLQYKAELGATLQAFKSGQDTIG